MRIVLLEDDPLQSQWIKQELMCSLGTLEIDIFESEKAFRDQIDRIVKSRPDFVILDVMVRWTNPTPDLEVPPKDVRDGGAFRAGLRCRKLLHDRDASIRAVLYTILDKPDLKDEIAKLKKDGVDIIHIRKEADPQRLLGTLRPSA